MQWIVRLKRLLRSPQTFTRYWAHITDPQYAYQTRLVDLLVQTPIDYPGQEFILPPHAALKLVDELTTLGIAISGISVWCYVPPNTPRETCCPDGYGGPSRLTPTGREWFSEYTQLGYAVPRFDKLPHTRDLAMHTNPLIKHYLLNDLPCTPGYNDHFRVALDLHIPSEWDLFPPTTKHQ